MPNWLLIVQVIVQLIPTVVQAIMAVEQAVGPGNGQAKQTMVVGALAPAVPPEVVQVLPAVVNAQVAGLNAAGVLKKSTPAAA